MDSNNLYSILMCVLPFVDDRRDINALQGVCRASNAAVQDYLRDGDRCRRFLQRGFYGANILQFHPRDLADWRIIACDQHSAIEFRLILEEKHLTRVLDCMDDDVFIYFIEVIFTRCNGGFESVERCTKVIELLRRPRIFPFDVIAWHFPPTTPQNRLMLRFCARIPVRFDAYAARKREQARLRHQIAQQIGKGEQNYDPIWRTISVASRAQLILMVAIPQATRGHDDRDGCGYMPDWENVLGLEMWQRHPFRESARYWGCERAIGPNIESLEPEVKKEYAKLRAILEQQIATHPADLQNPRIQRFLRITDDDLVRFADDACHM